MLQVGLTTNIRLHLSSLGESFYSADTRHHLRGCNGMISNSITSSSSKLFVVI